MAVALSATLALMDMQPIAPNDWPAWSRFVRGFAPSVPAINVRLRADSGAVEVRLGLEGSVLTLNVPRTIWDTLDDDQRKARLRDQLEPLARAWDEDRALMT